MGGFSFYMRNIYVYADESGVFDQVHNDLYTFGGIILPSQNEHDRQLHRYRDAEARVRRSLGASAPDELKATLLSPKHKTSLYKSANIGVRFGAVIHQDKVLEDVFADKKDKQRYLDYAFQFALRTAFEHMICEEKIRRDDPIALRIIMDQHSTATNGIYELGESIEQEFTRGTFDSTYQQHFPPVLSRSARVSVKHADSALEQLVRAADVVANRLLWMAKTGHKYRNSGIVVVDLPVRVDVD